MRKRRRWLPLKTTSTSVLMVHAQYWYVALVSTWRHTSWKIGVLRAVGAQDAQEGLP